MNTAPSEDLARIVQMEQAVDNALNETVRYAPGTAKKCPHKYTALRRCLKRALVQLEADKLKQKDKH